jgi:Transglutaminase-like superfamily
MSMPVMLEKTARLPWRRQIPARLAVAVARPVSRLSPRRLRWVLELARRGARPATAAQASAARTVVVSVSVACAGQGCLLRSVATALLCRLGGTWPDWCTGVRTQPFRAHAWVEVDGSPIDENHDIQYFCKVMTVPARR